MHRYVAHANIDHFLGLLDKNDVPPENRAVITKLLIAEEDKLARGLEQLEFAESRAAKGRDRVNHLRNLRDGFVAGSAERAQADRLLTNIEDVQRLLEDFCHQMRQRAGPRSF